MTATLQKTTARLTLTDGETATVAAYRVLPGVVAHRSVEVRNGDPVTGKAWVLSHERTGKRLGSALFRTRADAADAADAVAWVGWDLEDPVGPLTAAERGLVARTLQELATADRPGMPRRAPVRTRVTGDDMRAAAESFLPDGWELYDNDPFGDLVCPCGHRIEPDGVCPSGHASPLPI